LTKNELIEKSYGSQMSENSNHGDERTSLQCRQKLGRKKQRQTEYLSKSGIRNRINEKVLALNRKRSSFTKGGKVPSASDVSSYNREANEIQKRVTEANDRGNVGAQYQVMKEYAKKYGWNLTRKRTS
jgi:hypothetical protein